MFSVVMDYLWNRPQHFRRKEQVAGDERDITNHIVIVTGANHGIGQQTALELAKRGARVVMACRDLAKAEKAKAEILEDLPSQNAVLEFMKLDLADSSSVLAFSNELHKKFSHIDMLINNAGIYIFEGQLVKTKDGHERHMGTNHLNTFYLTSLLMDLLNKSEKSRIINVSSMAFQAAELDVNDLNLEKVQKLPMLKYLLPYANSKLANVLFTRELARRLGENSKINVYALCPGSVNVRRWKEESWMEKAWFMAWGYFMFFDVETDGALMTLHCALSKSLENESGKMYRLLDVWDVESMLDDKQAAELWTKSEEIIGHKFQIPSSH